MCTQVILEQCCSAGEEAGVGARGMVVTVLVDDITATVCVSNIYWHGTTGRGNRNRVRMPSNEHAFGQQCGASLRMALTQSAACRSDSRLETGGFGLAPSGSKDLLVAAGTAGTEIENSRVRKC